MFGSVWAQADVRKALKASGADVLEGDLGVGTCDLAFGDDDALVDPDTTSRLSALLAELVDRAGVRVEGAASR